MTETQETSKRENSKRRFLNPIISAAFLLSSNFSLGKRSDDRKQFGKTKLQQLFIICSIYAFIIPVIYSTTRILNEASAPSSSASQPQQNTLQSALNAQVRGYEIVLQREPNNLTALEGLANAKMQTKDYAGAIEVLQNLVEQYPERSDFVAMLSEAKQKAAQK